MTAPHTATDEPGAQHPGAYGVSYLVGGLRVSIDESSTTPGARTHIIGFIRALDELGGRVKLTLASSVPGLTRFKGLSQSSYKQASRKRILVADFVRIGAMFWSGCAVTVRHWSNRNDTRIVYERGAVFQSLASFHPAKRRAVRVVEANAVVSKETAKDRKAIVLAPLAEKIERHTFRKADLVVAVSKAVGDAVVEFAGISPEKVLVLPNATSESLTDLPLVEDGNVRIGFAGSVVAWQRLDRLIRAVASVSRTRQDVFLQIVGDGPERSKLESLASELGIADRVDFVGRVPHAKAIELMRSWTVGYAGHEKTWADVMYHSPLKVYEYAAYGMHLLCTTTPDALSLKADGSSVHNFEPASEDGLEQALASALAAQAVDTTEARGERRRSVRANHIWRSRAKSFLDQVEFIERTRRTR